jgi:membrane protein
MNKKIWIRVRDHRKVEKNEEKKGFLEKYKDVLGALVSIVTLLGSVYVIMVVLFQFIYAQQAESFYYIERSYFAKEDLGLAIRLSLVFMLYLLWFLLPLLPFIIERRHNYVVLATEPNWSGKDTWEIIGHCFFFCVLDLLFCIYFSPILADAIKWYYTNHADAFRLGGRVLLVLIVAYFIQCIIRCLKENFSINIFYKPLKEKFFYAKIILIIIICSPILYSVLLSNIFGDKAIQINNIIIFIMIVMKILSFILAQLFYFGRLSSKPEKYTGGQPEEQKDNNDCKNEQDQSKEFKLNGKQIVAVVLLALFSCIIFLGLIYVCHLSWSSLTPKNKKYYEIVQLRNTPDYEINGEQKASDSNLQVVILHRGSQVLLMNGSIENGEGQKIISTPKEIRSSSNLYLDISSYEIQDVDKYTFYGKRFASVKRKYGDYLLDKDDEEKK